MLSPDAPATVVRRGAAENGAAVADMRCVFYDFTMCRLVRVVDGVFFL